MIRRFSNPEQYFNQFLKSRTTTSYNYGSNYTTEVVVYEDFENSDNNYIKNNYSSSGSKNAEESDRIELERDANGCIILNNENADEPIKLEHTVAVVDTSGTVPAGWLGRPASTTKEISIPATFAPIAKKKLQESFPTQTLPALWRYINLLLRSSQEMRRKELLAITWALE